MKEIRDLRADEVELRVGSATQKGASYLLYKDARCDMNILDETFGIFGWQREHSIIDGKEFCKVSVYDTDKDQWISKMDTGTESNTEAEKGRSSDCFKRACFNIGIGRELYSAPFIFINVPTEQFGTTWRVKKPYPNLKVARMDVKDKKIVALEVTNTGTGEIVYSFPKSALKVPKSEPQSNVPRCSRCGEPIYPIQGFTTDRIVEITTKKMGKQLCYECYRKAMVEQNG